MLSTGKVFPFRAVLHGAVIPKTHMCETHFVCGDEVENSFLRKGMFFAIPVTDLYGYI